MTHFLRVPDAAAWTAAATDAGFLTEAGLAAYTHDHAIDVVGMITQGGEYGPEMGEVIAAPEVLPGFHINFIGVLPSGWEGFMVTPSTPYRVFAS
jgi:hypothetical protein